MDSRLDVSLVLGDPLMTPIFRCVKISIMLLDIYAPEEWDRMNAELSNVWNSFHSKSDLSKLQIHPGLAPGLRDTLLGLAQIYSHKRTIAVIKGNSWAVDLVLPWFLKEAYSVQSVQLKDLLKDPAKWIHELKKDTVFTLFSEDNPITAQRWEWDEVDRLLNESKIFSVRISHHSFIENGESVRPLSCRFLSLDDTHAVSLSGEKFHVVNEIAPYRNWDIAFASKIFKERMSTCSDQKIIEDFESQFPGKSILPIDQPRTYDRSLLSFPNVGADALISAMGKHTGSEAGLESLQGCRWQSVRLTKKWWQDQPPLEQLRGALLISLDRVKQNSFAKALHESYEELLQAQSW